MGGYCRQPQGFNCSPRRRASEAVTGDRANTPGLPAPAKGVLRLDPFVATFRIPFMISPITRTRPRRGRDHHIPVGGPLQWGHSRTTGNVFLTVEKMKHGLDPAGQMRAPESSDFVWTVSGCARPMKI